METLAAFLFWTEKLRNIKIDASAVIELEKIKSFFPY
jgi:hypothetical protein